ncbi:MAG TPA: hypothetical protein PK014_07030 [Thermoanaerobaculia bacterium]|nr:hypothetical protein [Thermoanaerobaculia bacterium]HUM29806.1 hypothetical protein [Thermoanaerobaculia bacterium]HXK68081.1 hypothetical protein [Thermoanaerobaculia bacterium]
MKSILWIALAFTIASFVRSENLFPADEDTPRFLSPDGTRVVRLYFLDTEASFPGGKSAPILQVEYSMVMGTREILIRTFTPPTDSDPEARFSVRWKNDGRGFLVLSDQTAHRRNGKELEKWEDGNFVVFFFDRVSGVFPPSGRFRPIEWKVSHLSAQGDLHALPVRTAPDNTKDSEVRIGETGFLNFRLSNLERQDRILNFTLHPNTQKLRMNTDGYFSMPDDQVSQPSPDGRFTAHVSKKISRMVLLSEGTRFLDQIWVLLYPLRYDGECQLAWSKDSRYLLLVTNDSGMKGLTIMPDGEELYLLFDTREWNGVLGPEKRAVDPVLFPDLLKPRPPARKP